VQFIFKEGLMLSSEMAYEWYVCLHEDEKVYNTTQYDYFFYFFPPTLSSTLKGIIMICSFQKLDRTRKERAYEFQYIQN